MKIQKAKHLHLEMAKKKPDCVGKEYMIFEKHDGWFGYLDFPSCIIHSRAYREIPSLVELSNLIRSKRPDCKGRLIFEIMIEGLEIDSFPKLNGILNRKDEQVEDVYLKVHDFIPMFRPFDMVAEKRYSYAKEVVERIDLHEVQLSEVLRTTADPAIWDMVKERMWLEGKEGIILKHTQGLYYPEKRNSELMKVKEELTLDLRVIGVDEGTGKYQGTTGTLVVMDSHGLKHNVSGMSDAQRHEWWANPSTIVGKIVEIKAMKRLADGGLREPRFKAIRWDKTEID